MYIEKLEKHDKSLGVLGSWVSSWYGKRELCICEVHSRHCHCKLHHTKKHASYDHKLGQCKYVTCSWNDWSSWSATCGTSFRQRTSKATDHVINKPSCSDLQTSCPGPQLDTKTTNCKLNHWTVFFLRCYRSH